MTRGLGASACALALGLAACANEPPPLDVAVSGCAAVRADAVCEIPDSGALRLSVRTSAAARVVVQTGAQRTRIAPDGATEHVVHVTPGHFTRSLVVTVDEGGAAATFRLELAARRAVRSVETLCAQARSAGAPEDLEALERRSRDADPMARRTALRCLARRAYARRENPAAEAHLDAAIRIERSEGRLSDEVDDHLLLARIHLFERRDFAAARADIAEARGLTGPYPTGAARVAFYEALLARETGDVRHALAWFDETLERAARLGLDELGADAFAASAEALRQAGRYAEALAAVHEAQATLPPGANACVVADKLNDEGWTLLRTPPSERTSDDDPTIALDQSLGLAHRAGCDAARLTNTLTNLALASAEQGAWEEACALVARMRLEQPQATVRTAYSWIEIEAGALLARDAPEEALARYDELAQAAVMNRLPGVEIDAAIGRGRALAALGREAEAERAFEDAETAVARALHRVALGGGRDTFAAMHERTTSVHVDFLLRRALGKSGSGESHGPRQSAKTLTGPYVERAVEVAVRSIGRTLEALQSADRIAALSVDARAKRERAIREYLDARDALDVRIAAHRFAPLDRRSDEERALAREANALLLDLDRALAAPSFADSDDAVRRAPREPAQTPLLRPERDELILVFYPSGSHWIGFAVRGEGPRRGAEARWLGELPEALRGTDPAGQPGRKPLLARLLLQPFREAIEAAGRVRVIAHGPLARVPFHALPWNGARLLDHAPVAYGLGIPAGIDAPQTGRRALVLGDVSFPGAAHEAEEVTRRLARQGFAVERLEGERALASAVRTALAEPGVVLAHFAGHASHGGVDGLEGALRLAQGTSLTVADLLALQRVPPFIVLSACDTSTVSAEARGAGLGLAQAFLVAGAKVVVASIDKVEDGAAARLGAGLYDGTFDLARPDLVSALRDAQRAEREGTLGGAPTTWRLFRAIVP